MRSTIHMKRLNQSVVHTKAVIIYAPVFPLMDASIDQRCQAAMLHNRMPCRQQKVQAEHRAGQGRAGQGWAELGKAYKQHKQSVTYLQCSNWP